MPAAPSSSRVRAASSRSTRSAEPRSRTSSAGPGSSPKAEAAMIAKARILIGELPHGMGMLRNSNATSVNARTIR